MIAAMYARKSTKVGFTAWLVMFLGIILVASCTSASLRHPETGEIVRCGPYLGDPSPDHSARLLKRGCIEEYGRQGYKRVME